MTKTFNNNTAVLVNGQWFEEPSVSHAVHVSPEGRSSEVAGARLARRTNGQWSMFNGYWF